MSIKVYPSLAQALKDEGFDLPDQCIDIDIECHLNQTAQIVYRCHLTREQMVKFGKAFVARGSGHDPAV